MSKQPKKNTRKKDDCTTALVLSPETIGALDEVAVALDAERPNRSAAARTLIRLGIDAWRKANG